MDSHRYSRKSLHVNLTTNGSLSAKINEKSFCFNRQAEIDQMHKFMQIVLTETQQFTKLFSSPTSRICFASGCSEEIY